MRLGCKYALFYCPFAFRIDAKIQYVVANFVQNVMWCLQRKKSNGTVKLKVLSTAPLTFLPFLPFSYSVRQTVIVSAGFCDRMLTFTECFILLQKRTGNCIVYKRLQHCTFFGNATAVLAKETKIRFAIYIKPISAN